MGIILTIFKFFAGNYKILMYAGIAMSLMGIGWKAYNIISENAANKVYISQLERDIQSMNARLLQKDYIIQTQKKNFDIADEVIKEKDNKINKLNQELSNILVNLGDDSNDQAAQSLKELIKRMGERRIK